MYLLLNWICILQVSKTVSSNGSVSRISCQTLRDSRTKSLEKDILPYLSFHFRRGFSVQASASASMASVSYLFKNVYPRSTYLHISCVDRYAFSLQALKNICGYSMNLATFSNLRLRRILPVLHTYCTLL